MTTATASATFTPALSASDSLTSVDNASNSFSSLYSALQSSHDTSPKQFIPVAVLVAFLILLFFSHLMRYPRILYVSPQLVSSHSQTIHEVTYPNRQEGRSLGEKQRHTRNRTFWRISISQSKPISSFNLRTEAAYHEPTVRLVRSYHNRSPEPRVYLPEEITLPSPSQTLVNSSRSDISMSNADTYGVPPRVYLPPVLPDISDHNFFTQQADMFYTGSSSTLRNPLLKPSSFQHPPGLFTSPQTPPLTTIYDITNVSSEALAVPFIQAQLPESSSPQALIAEELSEEFPVSLPPKLSPPPLAYTHPILVRRALAPLRRRSGPPLVASYDTFLDTSPENNIVSTLHHRPSVPSRLRYFITRSVTSSLSGSQTRSTPDSSFGKRSEKSVKENLRSVHVAAEPRFDGTERAEEVQSLGTPAVSQANMTRSESGATFDTQILSRSLRSSYLQDRRPFRFSQFHDPIHNSISEHTTEHQATSVAKAEEDTDVRTLESRVKRESSSMSIPEVHDPVPGHRNILGLGLRVVSEPIPAAYRPPGVLTPVTPIQTSTSADIGLQPHDERPRRDERQGAYYTGLSLRTVVSRWMGLSPILGGIQTLAGEESGRNVMTERNLADESVEIMFMGRSEGLDGV